MIRWRGDFLSVDPVVTDASTGNGFNRYTYTNNNPYRYIDPDGRLSCEDKVGNCSGGRSDVHFTETDSSGGGGPSKPVTPVGVNDINGNPVIGGNGKQLQIPAGIDLAFFAKNGRESYAKAGSDARIEFIAYDLIKFYRGFSWDLQRLKGGNFDYRFIDGATVAIGIYETSAEIDIGTLLSVQNLVARSSKYPANTVFDPI